MTIVNKRMEILFLYDIENANPNGDPNDENKPRIDEETGKNIVTDVRLKRTIRDYLLENKNIDTDIFVKEMIYDNEGHIQTGKKRAENFLPEDIENLSLEDQKKEISKNILEKCIDVRLFGATIPLELKVKKTNKTSSITFTGPVQFKMGKSLHAVKTNYFKGTGAFASKDGATQKTFREEYVLPYSLIAFHGIVNENAAVHTELKENDVENMIDAIWNGTKNLISRSKFGQMPRLLLVIQYKEPNYFIGDIDNIIALKTELRDEQIRKPENYKIDLSNLLNRLNDNDKVEKVRFITDERMTYLNNGEDVNLANIDKFEEYSTEVL